VAATAAVLSSPCIGGARSAPSALLRAENSLTLRPDETIAVGGRTSSQNSVGDPTKVMVWTRRPRESSRKSSTMMETARQTAVFQAFAPGEIKQFMPGEQPRNGGEGLRPHGRATTSPGRAIASPTESMARSGN
jgi:hypothetical protein